uniref:Histone-binding protein RBBP4-like N-terminal domain-containing protein n=1 Tax=Timema douglasi TaxID=61478 RepID=A0A7R8VVM3_TIMDO|nr:unnamed protein product [Timema douglasi]
MMYTPELPLGPEEELRFDKSAYIMLHSAQTGNPCLSFDIIRDNLGERREEFPLTAYVVGGTQAAKARSNSVLVVKMVNLTKIKKKNSDDSESDDSDDSEDSDGSDLAEEELPQMHCALIKHAGCVNRIRASVHQGAPLVATWSELGRVNIWNISLQLAAVDSPLLMNRYKEEQHSTTTTPLFTFSGHQVEGFALDWSSVMPGMLQLDPLYLSSALAQAAPPTLSNPWTIPPSVTSSPLYSVPLRTPLSISLLGGHYRSRFLAPIGSSLFSRWTKPGSSGGYLTWWFLGYRPVGEWRPNLVYIPPRHSCCRDFFLLPPHPSHLVVLLTSDRHGMVYTRRSGNARRQKTLRRTSWTKQYSTCGPIFYYPDGNTRAPERPHSAPTSLRVPTSGSSKSSPRVLATGDCKRDIHVWNPSEGGTWLVDQRPLIGHVASVEDVQWSPNERNVLASCSVDKRAIDGAQLATNLLLARGRGDRTPPQYGPDWTTTHMNPDLPLPSDITSTLSSCVTLSSIRIWDTRSAPNQACKLTASNAHDSDVNVISWNRNEPFIASGGDDGVVHIWDLRQFQSESPVATFKHHIEPVTTVEWHPTEATVFASGGADNQVALWDLSVERDMEPEQDLKDLPQELLFIHQGQTDIKELHWHPQLPGVIFSTAQNGFNVFRTISV